MKKLIIDLDNTITLGDDLDYTLVSPNKDVVQQMHHYKKLGFSIVIYTARNMRTYEGNIGKINIHTLPTIITWLDQHKIPYDEVIVGKPWCGHEGFYVDDRAIRPREFISMDLDEINQLLENEKQCS